MPQRQVSKIGGLGASLDIETRVVVQQGTSEFEAPMCCTAPEIVKAGLKLAEVKAQLGYGPFHAWPHAKFGWGESAAAKFIHVARWFEPTNLADLQIALSAFYSLAAPFTPGSVFARAPSGPIRTGGSPTGWRKRASRYIRLRLLLAGNPPRVRSTGARQRGWRRRHSTWLRWAKQQIEQLALPSSPEIDLGPCIEGSETPSIPVPRPLHGC